MGKPKTAVNKAIDAMHLVGNELNEFDPGKVAKRSMFDRNVVYHMQSLEHMLDYTFSHLGLSKESHIDYPMVMTEAMCNPNYCRGLTSELLFECYKVPAICYGVDSLFSYHYNAEQNGKPRIGLIVDASSSSTHIIPVVNDHWNIENTRRISLGGAHHTELLFKTLSMRYP